MAIQNTLLAALFDQVCSNMAPGDMQVVRIGTRRFQVELTLTSGGTKATPADDPKPEITITEVSS